MMNAIYEFFISKKKQNEQQTPTKIEPPVIEEIIKVDLAFKDLTSTKDLQQYSTCKYLDLSNNKI